MSFGDYDELNALPPTTGPGRFGNLSKLATALAKAQSEIEDATKDATNPHFKSRYADLASVRAAVRKPLSDNGIAYVQLVRAAEKSVEVETILIHGESGQSIGETLRLPLQQPTPQAVGSCISYGRRYSLMSIVGIAADDDDGEAATRGMDGTKPKRTMKEISENKARKETDYESVLAEISEINTAAELEHFQFQRLTPEFMAGMGQYQFLVQEHLERRRQAIFGEPGFVSAPSNEPQTKAEYIQFCHEQIANAPDAKRLEAWWKSEVHARKRFRLSIDEVNDLRLRAEDRDKEFLAPTPIVSMG